MAKEKKNCKGCNWSKDACSLNIDTGYCLKCQLVYEKGKEDGYLEGISETSEVSIKQKLNELGEKENEIVGR